MTTRMKRLYVIYGGDDRPRAECERLRDTYRQARECLTNGSEYITIDIYMWDWARGYTYECSGGDFYFMDRKRNVISSSDLADAGILWYSLTKSITLEDIEKFEWVFRLFELGLNDISIDAYKKFYSFKRKKNE